jgi:hypothetical protein
MATLFIIANLQSRNLGKRLKTKNKLTNIPGSSRRAGEEKVRISFENSS